MKKLIILLAFLLLLSACDEQNSLSDELQDMTTPEIAELDKETEPEPELEPEVVSSGVSPIDIDFSDAKLGQFDTKISEESGIIYAILADGHLYSAVARIFSNSDYLEATPGIMGRPTDPSGEFSKVLNDVDRVFTSPGTPEYEVYALDSSSTLWGWGQITYFTLAGEQLLTKPTKLMENFTDVELLYSYLNSDQTNLGLYTYDSAIRRGNLFWTAEGEAWHYEDIEQYGNSDKGELMISNVTSFLSIMQNGYQLPRWATGPGAQQRLSAKASMHIALTKDDEVFIWDDPSDYQHPEYISTFDPTLVASDVQSLVPFASGFGYIDKQLNLYLYSEEVNNGEQSDHMFEKIAENVAYMVNSLWYLDCDGALWHIDQQLVDDDFQFKNIKKIEPASLW